MSDDRNEAEVLRSIEKTLNEINEGLIEFSNELSLNEDDKEEVEEYANWADIPEILKHIRAALTTIVSFMGVAIAGFLAYLLS